ncbi:hypothetical protein LCGC14_1344060 [marine sediment metagenome]|uniref:Uncharacterized protein n=1 Tax=marine sediment metagenome TaxID=412755 RepID=A0A0F9KCU4_9ZZZZ
MPTGYTDCIKDGISFNDFVMQCARAMGACIMMRDDPPNKEIPEKFEPSDYHQKKVREAEYDLARYQKIDTIQADLLARHEYDTQVEEYKTCIEEAHQLQEQYTRMLEWVREWQSPTQDHDGLKEFMDQQIRGSIDFDCDTSYYKKPKLLSGREWLSLKTSGALHDIDYHAKEDLEERKRAAVRTLWIQQLRKSLLLPEPA